MTSTEALFFYLDMVGVTGSIPVLPTKSATALPYRGTHQTRIWQRMAGFLLPVGQAIEVARAFGAESVSESRDCWPAGCSSIDWRCAGAGR